MGQFSMKYMETLTCITRIYSHDKVFKNVLVTYLDKYILFMSGNISNTSDSVSSGYPNTEKRVENTTRSGVFLTKFEVFGYPMKHCLECLIYLLNRNKN